MLDDDDVGLFALFGSDSVIGPISFIVFVVVIVALAVAVDGNKAECAALHCAAGTSQLVNHECECVVHPSRK